MKTGLGFRGWFYFRQGWATYFAFIFAAVNTLTVTYFLAIERYPFLTSIFPNFVQYVLIVSAIGIPLLILVGFIHYKRTLAFKSEMDVLVESNPYMRRTIVNTEIILSLMLELSTLVMAVSKDKKPTDEEIKKITQLQNTLSNFTSKRKFSNNDDLQFLKEQITKS